MRYIVKVVAVVGIVAGSMVAATGSASAAPVSATVKPHAVKVPGCASKRCPQAPAVSPGPFKLNTRGPVGGPVTR